MRKRFHHFRVCSSSPQNGVTYIDSHLLRDIVNREIHPIRCASTCGRKALKGLVLGDLCAESFHPRWAIAIWGLVIEQIHDKDYNDWVDVWFNTRYVQLRDVISDGLCEILGRRIDDVQRRFGLGNPQGMDSYEYWAGDFWYDSFSYEKYDNNWDYWRNYFLQVREEAMTNQATERIFREGQGELPPCAQDFFHYWEDFDPTTQNLYFKIDDWN